jgi:hypothetical protein
VPAGWTPDQIRQFQDYWDTEFAGDLAKRRRAKFVPGESAVRVHQTKEPEHKQDFDEWLARIICYAFSVPPQWAVKLMNRATADNQSAQAEDEGLEPTKEWVKDLVDEVIADEFASPDLELLWLDEDSGAAEIEAQFEARVKIGAATLNELRDALGLDPFQNPAADRPMVLTPTGYVPIDAGAGGSSSPGGGAQPANAQAAPAVQKYSPDQPREPAGNPHGGEWTSGGGLPTGSEADSPDNPKNETPLRVVANDDPRVLSDAPDPTWAPGARSAQYRPRGGGWNGGPVMVDGELLEPTPGQAARLVIAESNWRAAVARAKGVDPNWHPTPGYEETVEGLISNLEAETKEAENHRSNLACYGIGPGPFAGESIPARGPDRNFTAEEREEINRIGSETGCHTCGTKEPGTRTDNFVPDHQLPSALNSNDEDQRLYPQCLLCSRRQGGWITGHGGGR